jgi:4-diphosphocytidyl-2-C-methyl-D-erythritol kinase
MLAFPNAKINLGLNVTGTRPDGFHDIETVMLPVAFCDILEIEASRDGSFDFMTSGLTIPGNTEDNLCIRAYELFKDEFKIPGVSMNLHKVIPMGSGLGGGSSDAAYTIRLLNDIFSLSLSPAQMMQYASRLGSDCSFFIKNIPGLASGKGDQFEAIDIKVAGYSIVIVIPPVHVSTKEAYGLVRTKRPVESLRTILKTSPCLWKDHLKNDFEDSLSRLHPEIIWIKETLYEEGAIYASMSGSGSSVYGLFDRPLPDMESFKGCIIWSGKLF